MNFENIKKFIQNKKIKITEDEFERAFYFEFEDLYVGVFDDEYPNTNRNGKILAEYKINFDKWSNAFYESNVPDCFLDYEEVMEIIFQDLDYLSNNRNKKFSNNFGAIKRYF